MVERRDFLRLSAAALGAALLPIERALALPGDHTTGSIRDVAHIVVLMQENRSFDHYFGTMAGVRGHNDRFPTPLPDGQPVWYQPRRDRPTEAVLPFHLDTHRTAAQATSSLDHSWRRTQAALQAGINGAWPQNKSDLTMGHYTRADIPFHFALGDAFTVCDQYFCSIPGATHPNRMFLMTGTNDPTGRGGGPVIDNVDVVDVPKLPPFTWTTYPERLQAAGISWQVYQQGLDWKDPYNGNFGLNVLQNFKAFIEAPEDSPLHARGFSVRTLDQFAEDARADRLPQVSWLMPPAAFSEHPRYMPAFGATYIARVLEALTADPGVWAKTALLVMYDENDGYFDHIMPPQPPTPALRGASTVSTEGEVHDVVNPLHKPLYTVDNLPYGLGPRVPMMAISPWSKGGFVNSQVFDHTSVIRFIEARFGVAEPNISPWRRAVCGDLTSVFDFSRPDATAVPLPSTRDYRAMAEKEVSTLPPPSVPPGNWLMPQEKGTRPAHPLPYALEAVFTASRNELAPGYDVSVRLINNSTQGTSVYVFSDSFSAMPWRFTVGAGHTLTVPLPSRSDNFELFGPNGFYRAFVAGRPLHVTAEARGDTLSLTLRNDDTQALAVDLVDWAYGADRRRVTLAPHDTHVEAWDLRASNHWYDVAVTTSQGPNKPGSWRFAGHVETGAVSTTDPAAVKSSM